MVMAFEGFTVSWSFAWFILTIPYNHSIVIVTIIIIIIVVITTISIHKLQVKKQLMYKKD